MALELRTACERCGGARARNSPAEFCTFECTFCPACAAALDHICPNCDGELVPRPRPRT
jgi:hypothetical protein